MTGWALAAVAIAAIAYQEWRRRQAEDEVGRLEAALRHAEADQARAVARLEPLEEQLNRESRRAAEFVEQLVALKREGFHVPEPTTDIETPTEALPSVIVDALSEVSAPGTALWSQEAQLAAEQIAAGANPDEVAEAIERGGSYNPLRRS